MQQCSVTVFLWQELSKEEVGFSWSFSVVFVCFVSVSELLMGEVDSSTLLSVLPSEKSRVSVSVSVQGGCWQQVLSSCKWCSVIRVTALWRSRPPLKWDSHEHTWLMCMMYMWHNVWYKYLCLFSLDCSVYGEPLGSWVFTHTEWFIWAGYIVLTNSEIQRNKWECTDIDFFFFFFFFFVKIECYVFKIWYNYVKFI